MQHTVSILTSLVSQERDFFDSFIERVLAFHDQPVHSLQEMRQRRSTKMTGDLFEAWCLLFLHHKGYQCWLLKDVPAELLASFGMRRFDVGIDIIGFKDGRYSAIQCKCKRPRPGFVKGTWLPYNCVNWKEVSTFFSLCHRTQNAARWKHHIVMTNCKYVRRMGNPTAYDKTYAYGSFTTLTRLDLLEMIPKKRQVIIEEDTNDSVMGTNVSGTNVSGINVSGTNAIREARLAFYNKASML